MTWDDPLVGAALAREMSGLDYLRAVADGRIARPPIAALIGMSINTVEDGRVTFALDVDEHLYRGIGADLAARIREGPRTTERSLEMDDLLTRVLDAHSGLEKWSGSERSSTSTLSTCSGA